MRQEPRLVLPPSLHFHSFSAPTRSIDSTQSRPHSHLPNYHYYLLPTMGEDNYSELTTATVNIRREPQLDKLNLWPKSLLSDLRTLVNGDISWRYLGKNCGASVRTDSHKTMLTVVNEKHSVQYPVTMWSLKPDSRSNGASPSVLSLQDTSSPSSLFSPLTVRKSRSDSGSQTEDNHMKT
ncbi:hypothetical protein J6590_092065 [Homalodisca vitripennis]|nr:hypothetical protein J6590_088150 [Homalodisca vitripennis]KAG8275178.1 hypothetical protein J6590_092065 [Homalodisca vitripennis]